MWIRTQGGYLLNLDNVEYVRYSEFDDKTYAYGQLTHSICDGDLSNELTSMITANIKYMEVHHYD